MQGAGAANHRHGHRRAAAFARGEFLEAVITAVEIARLDLVERTDKGVGGSDSVEAEANGDKPPANAKKADLVAWLTANAVKEDGSDYTEAELDAMKVPELRELVDSIED